ncbi:fumarylacetoacetate hydrolase family protein [Ectothiorhodospiraceae bacterium WFHF3C12]|nr:fumarylacetoacetate hydrolase family protein [Ectothiorhodospiraceae bacterium WFHF3C12]
MKLASLLTEQGPHWGVVEGDELVLPGTLAMSCRRLEHLVHRGPDVARRWGDAVVAEAGSQRVELPLAKLDAPLRPNRNVMCLGLNYAEHARESLAASNKPFELPEAPVVFTKSPSSIIGPGDLIPYDPRISEKLDWEVELGVVIGKEGAHIPEERALEHVFGYTVINDVSARDLQFRHKQFYLGKSIPGGCPMGPWLVTADEIPDPHALAVECRVNGEPKQSSSTSDLIFGIPRIVHLLSRVHPLVPGDVIATGTPEGVGFARTPPQFLQPGDEVACEIQGIGTIVNRVAQVT